MSRVPAWFERRFSFVVPVEHYPNVCIRLQGTPARLDELVRGAPRDVLGRKPGRRWSPQEHVGHLFDLEPLWMTRVDDFLAPGDTLTAADLTNRRTDEANHNAREVGEILAAFRSARLRLVDRVQGLEPAVFGRTRLHPRLNQAMRLVDHLHFIAEHDDHHLATIWELIKG